MTVTMSELGSARVARDDPDSGVRAQAMSMLRDIALEAFEETGEAESLAAIDATPESWAATVRAFQRVTSATLAAPVPVLAAIDGVCIGGALEFAASCDLRLCTDRVLLMTPEVGRASCRERVYGTV